MPDRAEPTSLTHRTAWFGESSGTWSVIAGLRTSRPTLAQGRQPVLGRGRGLIQRRSCEPLARVRRSGSVSQTSTTVRRSVGKALARRLLFSASAVAPLLTGRVVTGMIRPRTLFPVETMKAIVHDNYSTVPEDV